MISFESSSEATTMRIIEMGTGSLNCNLYNNG